MITMTRAALRGVPQCPRCNRANPTLVRVIDPQTITFPRGDRSDLYFVSIYRCTTCERTVLAESVRGSHTGMPGEIPVEYLFPTAQTVHPDIPVKPRQFLSDALTSLSAPSASIMASCSAMDAMLKERNIGRTDEAGKERSLAKRIKDAVEAGVLTKEMSEWADKVRLDANDQRHADEDAELPTADAATNVFELADALAEILFVIPAKLKKAEPEEDSASD